MWVSQCYPHNHKEVPLFLVVFSRPDAGFVWHIYLHLVYMFLPFMWVNVPHPWAYWVVFFARNKTLLRRRSGYQSTATFWEANASQLFAISGRPAEELLRCWCRTNPFFLITEFEMVSWHLIRGENGGKTALVFAMSLYTYLYMLLILLMVSGIFEYSCKFLLPSLKLTVRPWK